MVSSTKNPLVLVIDCETSGLAFGAEVPFREDGGGEYQAVSWGLIVAELDTFRAVDMMYVEIKWNGTSLWSSKAEKVHGLSKQYLSEHGEDEADAVVMIAEFILKYWSPDQPIMTAGHNVGTFDLPFLRRLLHRHQLTFRFGNRHLDTYSIGQIIFGADDSNELFSMVGVNRDGTHNALADADAARLVLEQSRSLVRAAFADEPF